MEISPYEKVKKMTAKILDGKAIAQQLRQEIALTVQKNAQLGQRAPGLAVILVGSDPASEVYVKNKRLACQEVGFYSQAYDLPADIPESALLAKIEALNKNPLIDGILIQLPLPKHITAQKVLEKIAPHKDVDGFHAYNMGKLIQNQSGLRPCTPAGVIALIEHAALNLAGCEACVIGASLIVGRPMAIELLNKGATVTICHRQTRNLEAKILAADLLIVAIGNPHFIKGKWIKPDAVVIDIGTTRMADGKLLGDVEFEAAKQKASWITPVPGGVGPMTIAMLLKNTLIAAQASTSAFTKF